MKIVTEKNYAQNVQIKNWKKFYFKRYYFSRN